MNSLRYLLCLLGLLSLTTACEPKVGVADQANDDEAWYHLYMAVSAGLKAAIFQDEDVYDAIKGAHGYEHKIVRNAVKYATNYGPLISVSKVLYRYPHYNKEAVEVDLLALVEAGLFRVLPSGSYRTTPEGQQIVNTYWEWSASKAKASDKVPEPDLVLLEEVLAQLVLAASSLEDDFPNASIKNRIKSRPTQFSELPMAIKVQTYLREYTAFINDNAHYRYANYFSTQNVSDLDLSPLAYELLSASRSRTPSYKLLKCIGQPNWRVGEVGCSRAVMELEEEGLVQLLGGELRQTDKGKALYQSASEFSDQRLYKTWSGLTLEQYAAFRQVLYRLEEHLPPLFGD